MLPRTLVRELAAGASSPKCTSAAATPMDGRMFTNTLSRTKFL